MNDQTSWYSSSGADIAFFWAAAASSVTALEGRQAILLNIDKVIKLIRNSDEPKPDLMKAFKLSERQAEDILEIRLRQLARLEAIRIEQELKGLREEQAKAIAEEDYERAARLRDEIGRYENGQGPKVV